MTWYLQAEKCQFKKEKYVELNSKLPSVFKTDNAAMAMQHTEDTWVVR